MVPQGKRSFQFMTVKEIMEQIREGLTGEYNVDMVYLEKILTV